MKSILVMGWFTQPGQRINLNPLNNFPDIYNGYGFWFFSGLFEIEPSSGTITGGCIHDVCGVATVTGRVEGNQVCFVKQYNGRSDLIAYTLTATEIDGIDCFIGNYEGEGVGTGNALMFVKEASPGFF